MQVKSVIPFSEPFTVDPANPPPEKDYEEYFKTLKKGITGKESLEQTPVAAWLSAAYLPISHGTIVMISFLFLFIFGIHIMLS